MISRWDEFILYLQGQTLLDPHPFSCNFSFFQGTIPTELGLLFNLTRLRLSYNSFVGDETKFGNNLMHLQLIQINGNRLSGTIPEMKLEFLHFDKSSYVADCGNPSDFEVSLVCAECTMCCK